MICSLLLFWKERQKRDSLRVIFLKIDEINLLTVALFLRATIANRSQLLFLKINKSERAIKRRAKEQIPNPACWIFCLLEIIASWTIHLLNVLSVRKYCLLDISPLRFSVYFNRKHCLLDISPLGYLSTTIESIASWTFRLLDICLLDISSPGFFASLCASNFAF